MIICKKCGHRNADTDQWCTNPGCGAYLAFEGAVQDPPAEVKPEPDTTPTQPDAETLERLKATPPPSAPPPAPKAATQYQPQPPSASRPPPVAPSAQADSGIPPVRPGETVCANCRWGNDPTRAFCRHCGSPLASRGGATRPPAGPQDPAEGADLPRRWPWILAAALAAIVLLVAGGLLARSLTSGDDETGSAYESPSARPARTPQGKALSRDSVAARASTSEGDADARFLIDGDPQTYWAANPTESNPDHIPRLTFSLKAPDGERVLRMVVVSGGRTGDYDSRPRPKDICVRVDAGDCVDHELADEPGPQEIRVDAKRPGKQVEVEIKSVYPATEPGHASRHVTMREVTLYADR